MIILKKYITKATIIIFIIFTSTLHAQTNLDSLLKITANSLNIYRIDKDTIHYHKLKKHRAKIIQHINAKTDSILLAKYFSLESNIQSIVYKDIDKSLTAINKTIDIYKSLKDTLNLAKAFVTRSQNYFGFHLPTKNYIELEKEYNKYKHHSILVRTILYKKLSSIERFYFKDKRIDFEKMQNELLEIRQLNLNENKFHQYIDCSKDLLTFCDEKTFKKIIRELNKFKLKTGVSLEYERIKAEAYWRFNNKEKSLEILNSLIKYLNDNKNKASNLSYMYSVRNTYHSIISNYMELEE